MRIGTLINLKNLKNIGSSGGQSSKTGGVQWDIQATNELPNVGNEGDLYVTSVIEREIPKIINHFETETIDANTNTLSASIDCDIGDTILAQFVTRSEFTISNDWTILGEVPMNSVYYQRLVCVSKVATSTNETLTINCTNNGRIYINMQSIKQCDTITYLSDLAKSTVQQNTITSNKNEDGIYIWFADSVYWASGSNWTYTPNTMIVYGSSLQSSITPRLGTFIDNEKKGERTFKYGCGSDTSENSNQVIKLGAIKIVGALKPTIVFNSNINKVVLNNKLDITSNTIYDFPNDSINIFKSDSIDSTPTSISLFDFGNGMKITTNIIPKSIINHNNEQFKANIYLWDINNQSWYKCGYEALPLIYNDDLSLNTFYGIGNINVKNIFNEIGVQEIVSMTPNELSKQSDTLNFATFFNGGDMVVPNIFTQLNLTDEVGANKGNTSII